jgi:uncharacterized protein YpmB
MLEELQSLSDDKKKQVLIVATIIIMIIIIGAWAVYFNGVIMGTSQAADQATSTAAVAAPTTTPIAITTPAPAASGPSMWQDIEGWFGSIANIFKAPSQYTIQPQSN